MRRPAQPRPARTATGPGWIHPYTGPDALAVFYNDGGTPVTPPAPAPADPPKPGPPPGPAKEFTQEDLDRIAAREKAQGKRSALKDFAEEQGFTSPEDAAAFIAAARKAKEDALSEQERAQQQLEKDRTTVQSEREQIAAERRALRREQALTRIGAIDAEDAPNLQDALAMLDRDLRDAPDADETAVAEAAAKLKQRRPELFGVAPAQTQTLPPAPGGAPAGGGPRQPASKDDVNERAIKRAVSMGFRRPAA